MAYLPQHKAPYNNLRADKGTHKRSYTTGALLFLGLVDMGADGIPRKGKGNATNCDLNTLLGTSAYGYWTKKLWIIFDSNAMGTLSNEGLDTVEKSFKGEAHLVAIPGLVRAYAEALQSGILYNPGSKNVLERFPFPVTLNREAPKATQTAPKASKAPKATQTAPKATQTAPKASKAPKATQTAPKASKAPKATQTAPKAQVLITPKAK